MTALYIILIIISVIVLVINTLVNLPQFGQAPHSKHLERIKESKNFKSGRFINSRGSKNSNNLIKSIYFLPEWLNSKIETTPQNEIDLIERKKEAFAEINAQEVKVTWFGHSAILLEIDGKRLLIDPMLGPAASPFNITLRRFWYRLPIAIKDLPPIDAVIYSHDHYDHLDYASVTKLKNNVQHFYAPLGVGAHLQKWGVPKEKITELDWWDKTIFQGIELACTPAQHFSGRSFRDRDKTLWCSWCIKGKSKNIFFSGDSGYYEAFKKIGEKYGPFDLTMVECGQYNELWREVHMFPEESIKVHQDVKGKVILPIHWGAFCLAAHPWTEPAERILKAAAEKDITVVLPRIGESFTLDGPLPDEKWWLERGNKKRKIAIPKRRK